MWIVVRTYGLIFLCLPESHTRNIFPSEEKQLPQRTSQRGVIVEDEIRVGIPPLNREYRNTRIFDGLENVEKAVGSSLYFDCSCWEMKWGYVTREVGTRVGPHVRVD